MEKWKDIPGFEELYQVSNLGRVRNTRKGNILAAAPNCKGYRQVRLKGKQFKVHRLVLLAFVGHSDLEVLHADDDKLNNALFNLRYGTHSENMIDRTNNGSCNFTVEQVLYIRNQVQTGRKQKDLAAEFSVPFQTISDIIRKKRYSHV